MPPLFSTQRFVLLLPSFSREALGLHFLGFPCELPHAVGFVCFVFFYFVCFAYVQFCFSRVGLSQILSSQQLLYPLTHSPQPCLPFLSPGSQLRPSFSEWLIGWCTSLLSWTIDPQRTAAQPYAFHGQWLGWYLKQISETETQHCSSVAGRDGCVACLTCIYAEYVTARLSVLV